MTQNEMLEAVSNLLLKSISSWEDMHLYAMTYSTEYNAFWGLLEENLRSSVCRYRNLNRADRVIPYSMSLIEYYKVIITPESYKRVGGQYWKKQLKFILSDRKFRAVMTRLNFELRGCYTNDYRWLDQQTITNSGTQQFATRIG